MPKFKVGDKVIVDPSMQRPQDKGKVYKVTKVPRGANGVNYTVEPLDGGRGLRGAEYAFALADEAAIKAAEAKAEAKPYAPQMGEVVQVKPGINIDPDALYVVLGAAKNRADASRLVLLGGDDGRYFTGVPNAMLTVVAPASIAVKEAVPA